MIKVYERTMAISIMIKVFERMKAINIMKNIRNNEKAIVTDKLLLIRKLAVA